MRKIFFPFFVLFFVLSCDKDEIPEVVRDYTGSGNAVCSYTFNGIAYSDSVSLSNYETHITHNAGTDSEYVDTFDYLRFSEAFIHFDQSLYSIGFNYLSPAVDTVFLLSVGSNYKPYVNVGRFDDLSDPDAPCGGFSPHPDFLSSNYLLFDHFDTETGDFEIRFKTYLLEPSDCMGNEHTIELKGTVEGKMEF